MVHCSSSRGQQTRITAVVRAGLMSMIFGVSIMIASGAIRNSAEHPWWPQGPLSMLVPDHAPRL
jgi:hypothetical protein